MCSILKKSISEKRRTIINKVVIFFLVYVNFLANNASIDCIHSILPVTLLNGAVNNSLRCFPLSSFFTILRQRAKYKKLAIK